MIGAPGRVAPGGPGLAVRIGAAGQAQCPPGIMTARRPGSTSAHQYMARTRA